ncbi:MAG: glycosyltransferase family 4 protein [Cyanobacteria bacterium P01_H01_bin.121]
MRVLHVCAIGFTVRNLLLPQINFLQDQGISVEIACSPGPDVQSLQHEGYCIYPIQIDRRINPGSNLRSILQLTQLIRTRRYDLVHVHTPIAAVLGRVAAKLALAPRIVYTAHGFYFHERMPRKRYRFYHTIERTSGWLTDLILTQSAEDLATAQRSKLCKPQKVRYLGNGVDCDRFRPNLLRPPERQALRQQLGIPASASLLLGMTGRITAEKGYRELIQALATLKIEFPTIHLVVIGGQLASERDAFQAELQQLIQAKDLTNHVTFTGFRADVPELLSLLDIFTLPSYREGLPRSIIEAMATGLPVVATDIRGCREAVIDNETGLIVPPGEHQPLAIALGKLLRATDSRHAYGQQGRQRVLAHFDEQLVFQRLWQAYQDLGVR